jgi:hypothetical protein
MRWCLKILKALLRNVLNFKSRPLLLYTESQFLFLTWVVNSFIVRSFISLGFSCNCNYWQLVLLFITIS